MSKRRRKTKAEVLAGLQDFARKRAEANADYRRLISTGCEAQLIEQGTAVKARRIDVFQLLIERRALDQDAFDAVRAYEEDLAMAQGYLTPERQIDHIRGSTEGAPGQNITQYAIDASKRLQWVRDRMSRRDYRLLEALLNDHSAILSRWRHTVQEITGENRDECQAAAVRAMAENLRDVRERYKSRSREEQGRIAA